MGIQKKSSNSRKMVETNTHSQGGLYAMPPHTYQLVYTGTSGFNYIAYISNLNRLKYTKQIVNSNTRFVLNISV